MTLADFSALTDLPTPPVCRIAERLKIGSDTCCGPICQFPEMVARYHGAQQSHNLEDRRQGPNSFSNLLLTEACVAEDEGRSRWPAKPTVRHPVDSDAL